MQSRRGFLPTLLVLMTASTAALAGPGPAHTGAPAPHVTNVATPPAVLPMGRSVGSPTAGHLVGGAHLADAPYLRIVPTYVPGDVRWGLGALVGMLDRAARRVRHQYPDAVLSVGHLSRQSGGNLDRHASHESGRDADVAFYVKNAQGQLVFADHFVPFRGDGMATTWPGAVFDDAKNWALVAALLDDPATHVSHIFVASPLRARLLAYADRIAAPPALRMRAAMTMVQPHGSLPHDDHFHVRISCPAGMTGCIENPAVSRIARRPHAAHAPAARTPPPPAHATVAAPPPPTRHTAALDPARDEPRPPPDAPRPNATFEAVPGLLMDDADGPDPQ
jgi:penicillin-insensitive murein endopeptidase